LERIGRLGAKKGKRKFSRKKGFERGGGPVGVKVMQAKKQDKGNFYAKGLPQKEWSGSKEDDPKRKRRDDIKNCNCTQGGGCDVGWWFTVRKHWLEIKNRQPGNTEEPNKKGTKWETGAYTSYSHRYGVPRS